MQAVHAKLKDSEVAYERFSIERLDNHVVLRFPGTDKEFGYLRSAEAKVLSLLLDKPYLEFEPRATTSELLDIVARASKAADAIIQVEIYVYGPQRAATEVGDTLSDGKLWLQKPNYVRNGTVYDNPHFLQLRIGGVEPQLIQPLNHSAGDGLISRRNREERLRKMVEEVYRSLDRSRHLEAVAGGDGVTQKLLKHQEEALGFMMERETGHINDKFRLWEAIEPEDGGKVYRHRITREEVTNNIQPDESGGGILADEMGMGKSLSILALIMKMLEDGSTWALQEISPKSEGPVKRSRATLIIVPSALLVLNWIKEIQNYLREGLDVIKYHGSDRPRSLERVANADIVVTTYDTLTVEFLNKSRPSLLHSIDWYRVVLDEAHIIRRRGTSNYRACDKLAANSRWCLTGTPIQNKLADIGTLFTFIRVHPFSDPATFRRWIELPFEQNMEDSTVVKNRLIMLIEALCLRRTKDIVHLPQLQERLRKLEFSPEEREQYENTKNILYRMIRYQVGEVEKSSKFGLFQAHLQMRLLCNHGTFQQPFSWHRRNYRAQCKAVVSELGQSSEISCDGCKQRMPVLGSSQLSDGFHEQCSHILCFECMEQSNSRGERGEARHCPLCTRVRQATTEDGWTTYSGDEATYFSNNGHATKMKALIEDVKVDLRKTKSIIFSSWTRTLQLLSRYLTEAQVPYVGIDGNCSLKERQKKLVEFESEDTPVLIMTTGTGGVGLNLTCANRIFIVEPQWNPGVESQAIARAIRLGQKNNVEVTRYMIQDTIEEDMRSQQRWKKQLAALGFKEVADTGDEDMFIG
ncbi:hypothetical protein M419DRAFT_73008 [Trichoderma reesei RUT C-30]|uniref:Uncharacterized protein n=2 Tax=Hypocrea jecorina TaxID=51453 RepID=A0A024SGL3_HYPJR|nr:hypothetical protein M419DRAFT_73008 [Trichoderma reesei RUT C-30]